MTEKRQSAGVLLRASGLRKFYGDRLVLDIPSLVIRDGERIGLVGENGAGKSTLLAILAGEAEPDSGEVRRLAPAALIRQSGETRLGADPAVSSRFRAPEDRGGLSGGELTRRRIAAALSGGAPLLLADEPGTDLDLEGVAALREALARYDGALVLVSHDRALLDALCTAVWQLEDGHITAFPGGYTAWQEERRRRRDFQAFEYEQYRAEKKRLERAAQEKREWAASVRKAPKRMGNSEARLHTREYTNAVLHLSHASQTLQKRIDRLEVKERPREEPGIRMQLGAADPVRARTALEVRCRSLTAGGRTLLAETAFTLPSGSRTALVGPNGCGKSTLLRAVLGQTAPGAAFDGEARWNPAARVGRFDQDQARALDLGASVLDNVMSASSAGEADARTVLARLGLRGDAVFKPVRVLSGGERAKAALARVLLSDSNLLVLDEPTNHLDIYALEALQELLAGYAGTLLMVSHDEAMLTAAADRVVRFESGRLVTFEGTLGAMRADRERDRGAEALGTEIAAMEMRLAALSARLSAPRRGDDPAQLDREWQTLAERLRALRAGR